VTATGGLNEASVSWAASTDNVGVTRYNVYRGTTPGFTASASNRIASPTGTSYTDRGLAGGGYWYRVTAQDAAGNVSLASAAAGATVTTDTASPSVSITAPANGAVLSGTTTVTAAASDDVGVAGVQLKLDGQNLGSEDTASPYGWSWDTTTVADGTHTLTAVARDAAGHSTTSAGVLVTVVNLVPPPVTDPVTDAVPLSVADPVPAPTKTKRSGKKHTRTPRTTTTNTTITTNSLITTTTVQSAPGCAQFVTDCVKRYVRVRFRLRRAARVKVTLAKVSSAGPRRSAVRRLAARRGWNVVRFRARRLDRGRYVVRVVAVNHRASRPASTPVRVV
jgi:hypothetical protein